MNLLYQNDKAGHYPGSYYAASLDKVPAFRSSIEADENCELCIVGAGFTGLSAAIAAAQRGVDVIVIDAHRVAWGATGRNGGQLGSGQRLEQSELERSYGQIAARELWKIAEDAKALVKENIKRFAIQCDYEPGVIHCTHKQSEVADCHAHVAFMQQHYNYPLHFIGGDEIRNQVGSERYYAGYLDPDAGHLNPLKYAIALASAAEAAGVRIFEKTEATKIGKAVVEVGPHKIRCNKIIFATNGYAGGLIPRYASRVMPINNYIAATEVLEDSLAKKLIASRAAVADSKFVINYFRLSADNRMLFGGGESYGYRFPNDIAKFVRKPMAEIFPQLADTKIDYAWGGTLGITVNRMPYIDERDGVLMAGGFSGHGVAMASKAGQLLAMAYLNERSGFEAMAKVKTYPFPGGRFLRSPLLIGAMLYYAGLDRLG